MTTNQSNDDISVVLQRAQLKDVNIRIEPTQGSTVNFLDVTVSNENGQLRTSIHHKPMAEPYYLPYTSDHPHRIHRNIPYSALVRAARFCSHLEDFKREQLRLHMALLLNHYPPKLIINQFLRFFQVYRAEHLYRQADETGYQQLHNQALYEETRTTVQLQKLNKTDLVLHPPVLQKSKCWDRTLMYVPYIYENGITDTFPSTFYDWWKRHYAYPGSPANRITIRLITTTHPTLRKQLIRKKPSRELLTKLNEARS